MNWRSFLKFVPGREDVAAVGGLLLLSLGIARLSVAWAMITAGALIFALGLAAALLSLHRRG